MIVELFGAPGSGKTTLLPAVLESARHSQYRAYPVLEAARVVAGRTRPGRIVALMMPEYLHKAALWWIYYVLSAWSAARFALKRPKLVWYVGRSQRRRPPGAERRKRRVIYWFYRFTGSYGFFKRHLEQDEVVVFDEGFAHRAVQLFASSVEVPDDDQIAAYAGLLPKPDLLVYVDVPAVVCLERVRSRGVWARLADKDDADISRFVHNAHRAVGLMADQARRRGWPLVEVENGDVDHTTSSSRLQDLLGQTPAFAGGPSDA